MIELSPELMGIIGLFVAYVLDRSGLLSKMGLKMPNSQPVPAPDQPSPEPVPVPTPTPVPTPVVPSPVPSPVPPFNPTPLLDLLSTLAVGRPGLTIAINVLKNIIKANPQQSQDVLEQYLPTLIEAAKVDDKSV